MQSVFERFLMAMPRAFAGSTESTPAGSRRDFLSSALRVGAGLATMQVASLVFPERARARGCAYQTGQCECCFDCPCCSTLNFDCTNAYGACPSGGNCWTSDTCDSTICCDLLPGRRILL